MAATKGQLDDKVEDANCDAKTKGLQRDNLHLRGAAAWCVAWAAHVQGSWVRLLPAWPGHPAWTRAPWQPRLAAAAGQYWRPRWPKQQAIGARLHRPHPQHPSAPAAPLSPWATRQRTAIVPAPCQVISEHMHGNPQATVTNSFLYMHAGKIR